MAIAQNDRTLPAVDRPETKEFWEGCRSGKLQLPRCRSCGSYHWYPLPACPSCGSTDLEWQQISGKATLFTWTELRYPFARELKERLPILVALVSPEEAPEIRIVTNMVDCEERDLRIGMGVEVVFKEVNEAVSLPMFRPRRGG